MKLDHEEFEWVRDVAAAAVRATNKNIKSALLDALNDRLRDFFEQCTGNVRYPGSTVEINKHEVVFTFVDNEFEDEEESDDEDEGVSYSWSIDRKTGVITDEGTV